MKSYENALRNECEYEGAQPYVFFLLEDANSAIDWFRIATGIGP